MEIKPNAPSTGIWSTAPSHPKLADAPDRVIGADRGYARRAASVHPKQSGKIKMRSAATKRRTSPCSARTRVGLGTCAAIVRPVSLPTGCLSIQNGSIWGLRAGNVTSNVGRQLVISPKWPRFYEYTFVSKAFCGVGGRSWQNMSAIHSFFIGRRKPQDFTSRSESRPSIFLASQRGHSVIRKSRKSSSKTAAVKGGRPKIFRSIVAATSRWTARSAMSQSIHFGSGLD